ncbi:MAG: epoxyqueuosine reductase QueH [Lachnospiraceae bacterium]|jgi:predicted adenine nucleotide alpha hydrolase (AANH) superfamily ATPase|nr:epoxyqueuosine reductase QueH [Lachnospiraceae bacterium]
MNVISFQKETDEIITENAKRILQSGKPPRLLLHSCCAPCSSYVYPYLQSFFQITGFYDNPNIMPAEEYEKRYRELERLCTIYNERVQEGDGKYPILLQKVEYAPERFYDRVQGLEDLPEGGKRCEVCFALRLEAAAMEARYGGYEYMGTTLTVSPHKDATIINEIGIEIAKRYNIKWLTADFKKRDGYLKSIQASKQYHLYRQSYCGCLFESENEVRN